MNDFQYYYTYFELVFQNQDLPELKANKRCLMMLHEESMKLLEKVDSTPARDEEEYRKQRKALVHRLQVCFFEIYME